jgi:tRNA nucleotidyltransferase (CCA-adding enzyme)
MELFESEQDTALRELKEETGLAAALHPEFREMVSYPMSGGRTKQVVVFPGAASGNVALQRSEAIAFRWVSAEEAKQLLHPDFAPVMERVQVFLEESHG